MTLEKLEENKEYTNGVIKDEGNGYFSLIGKHPDLGFPLAYIMIPENHPDVSKREDDKVFWEVDVNGGFTYKEGNIFGWDYGNLHPWGTPEQDVKNAYLFFRVRELKHIIRYHKSEEDVAKAKYELLALEI